MRWFQLNIDAIDDNEFSTENFGNLINNIDQSIPSTPTEENTTAETIVSNTAGNPNSSAAASAGGASGGGGGY